MRSESVMHLPLDEIVVPTSRRDVDPEAVKRLASSIKEIGLRHPITVRSLQGKFHLVAGRHRLEATREIGEDRIAAVVAKFDAIDAELWEISENLHRAELTALERSEHIERWRRLKNSKVTQIVSPAGGIQPKESAVRKTADELGISQPEVQRAVKIASLSDEAKSLARETGLDDNRSALLEASREPTERQAEKIAEIAAEKAQSRPADSLADRQYQALVRAWNAASDEVRDRFAAEIAASEYAP